MYELRTCGDTMFETYTCFNTQSRSLHLHRLQSFRNQLLHAAAAATSRLLRGLLSLWEHAQPDLLSNVG